MVNSFGNTYSRADLLNLAKYATNVPIEKQSDKLTISSVASYPMTIAAYDAVKWAWNNKGHYKDSFQKVTAEAQHANKIFKNGGYKAVLNNASAVDILSAIPNKEAMTTRSSSTQDLYTKAQKYAEITKNNPSNKRAAKV